jgi:hypothetical protein
MNYSKIFQAVSMPLLQIPNTSFCMLGDYNTCLLRIIGSSVSSDEMDSAIPTVPEFQSRRESNSLWGTAITAINELSE